MSCIRLTSCWVATVRNSYREILQKHLFGNYTIGYRTNDKNLRIDKISLK